MNEAEILAAGKTITGTTIKEGKGILALSQLALLNELLVQLQGGGSGDNPVSLAAGSVAAGALVDGADLTQGTKDDAAVTDPTAESSIIATLKGLLKQLQGDGSGETPVTLATTLSAETDTINVAQMSKGGINNTHVGIGVAFSASATSTLDSAVISVLTGHTFKAGDVIYVDKGFASTSQTVVSIASTTITVGNTATSTESDVTVYLVTSYGVEIDCRVFRNISVECAVSAISAGNWVIEVLGSSVTGGTLSSCYRLNSLDDWEPMITPELDADGNYTFLFEAVPNYVKIKATRTTDGILDCVVTPFN